MTEREWERRLHIRSIGREDESSPHYAPYEPTPYPVLERLAQSGLVRRRDHLLDYGCGKGRVAFFMAASVGCRVTGIDRSPALITAAKENRKTCPKGDRVHLTCCSAEQYEIEGQNVFFFFNPFSEIIFECVLRRLARARETAGRPFTVLCYYPSEAYIRCLQARDGFEPLQEIDCRDLFSGRNPRERIAAWRLD
ncbi:MAG: class I SAM-dependent methyltransferase [Clostridia bacterium]|nr:class I SAM-dependent methyltransferase [Clostridia bacterium]